MEFTMENFEINPIKVYLPELISESVWAEDFFQEASDGVSKKNLLQTLWGMIRKLINVIAMKVREIGNWVAAFFHTKKIEDKTLDEIADGIFSDLKSEPGSKHLRFRYDNDQELTINIITNTIKKQFSDPKIVGHDRKDRPYQQAIMAVFNIIKKPQMLDPLIEFLTAVTKKEDLSTWPINRVQDALDSIWATTTIGLSCTITLREWTMLNEKVQALENGLHIVDDNTFMAQVQYDQKYASVMNQTVRLGTFLQLGINTIGDGMRQIYELDEKYVDAINAKNFRQKLPIFVKTCCESNIPSKYVHHAVRQICDVSINCNPANPTEKADVNKTLKGNGRFVIIPSDPSLQRYVIKVAYNGLGVRGNRNEFMVWDRVKGIPEIADELYHIEDINDPDNYVILCDRAQEIEKYEGCAEWNKNMREMCIRNNIGFIIRCNDGGFGKRPDGKVICIDYGNVRRIVD